MYFLSSNKHQLPFIGFLLLHFLYFGFLVQKTKAVRREMFCFCLDFYICLFFSNLVLFSVFYRYLDVLIYL